MTNPVPTNYVTSLTGNEQVQVLGVAANGSTAATTETTTVHSIAGAGSTASSAVLTATSNTVLAPIPGLSAAVVAGATYIVEGQVSGTAAAAGGITLAFGGAATVSNLNINSWDYNGTVLNAVTSLTATSGAISAAGNIVSNAAAYSVVFFSGTVTFASAGTITLQAAQNTSNATPTTVTKGAYLQISRVS